MLRLRTLFIALACSLAIPALAPTAARAQGGADGSIIGYVFDQAGNPLAGVQITATSPTQIGGAKRAYTNEEGQFRIRQLFPGTFQVAASAPKLKTEIQKNLKVGVTSAVEVNIVMEVQTGNIEEVRVVEKAPTVSTTTTNVKEVYDLDFVEAMPFNSRDQVFNQMVNQIGGAVGGRIRGGANNQTIMTQDGFDMRDQYPVTKASAAYEIQSAGYGADNATAAGGVVNLVTKTGSNKWEFEFNATAENDTLRLGKDSRDSPGNFYYLLNPALAGPIIKDKLWFAITGETHYLGRGRDADAEGILPTPRAHIKGINKGTAKLTWQMTPRNKLTYLMNLDSAWNVNMKNELGIEQESQLNRKAGLSGMWGFIWESLLTDDLVFRSQVGYSKRPQYWYPWRCEDGELGECDSYPGRINTFPRRVESHGTAVGCDATGECNNASLVPHRRDDLYVYQAFNRLQYFVDSKTMGEHSLVLKHQFYTEEEIRKRAQPGDYYDEYLGTVPAARSTFYSNDPRTDEARYGWWIGTNTVTRQVAAVSDAWRPTRHLTLTPALSWAWAYGSNSAGGQAIDSKAWAPSATVAWDATHDGRTVVRGGYSQYVDVAIRTPVIHTLGDQVSQRCLYNTETQAFDRECTYSGGRGRNTIGLPCGPTGVNVDGTPCGEPLKIPRTFEYTMGAEREVMQGIALSLDAVYRRYNNQYEQRETNRIWDASGTRVIGYRNGRNETVIDMGTPDGATRYYRGITAGFNKREGRGRLYLSYTISQLRGTVYNGANNPYGDIAGRDIYLDGPLPDDRLHDFKASGTYAATNWLSLGVRYTFASGFPYDRLFRNDVTNSYENRRSIRGTNPGTNLNDPGDDRALRLPEQQELNLQARVNLAPLIGHKLSLYADALNIMNLRTVTGYGANDGANFGAESGWMAPFRIRLGLDYKY
jgi:Carboxypeptidase regulatory-like domain